MTTDTSKTNPTTATSGSFSGKSVLFSALALLAYQLLPSGGDAPAAVTTPAAIDMFEALGRVRVAAKVQRAKLVAANRMPAETAISKLVAEAYEKYTREDDLAGTGPRATVTPTASTYSRPSPQASQPAAVPVSRGTYRPPPVPKIQPKTQTPAQPQAQASKPQSTGARPVAGQPGIGAMPRRVAEPGRAQPQSQRQSAGELDAGLVELMRSTAQRHPQAIGVFLGVGRGKLAAETLRLWSNSPGLYLVDPFIRQLGAKDQRADKTRQLEFEEARDLLKSFEGRHAFVRDLSFSFVKTMRDQKAQAALVLIDKDEHEAAIYQDLIDWWPIVGRGGVLAGRVYADESKLAIDRFARENTLFVKRTGDAWFFEKP